jgi:hypothetical protein
MPERIDRSFAESWSSLKAQSLLSILVKEATARFLKAQDLIGSPALIEMGVG